MKFSPLINVLEVGRELMKQIAIGLEQSLIYARSFYSGIIDPSKEKRREMYHRRYARRSK
ncbi:TPA: hypothetical protein DCQ22_03985 [Candidatus Nomurabacteria bacterium]|nr:hypothetical protein [Candidatus Nomurabacteria bacterium]